MGKGALKDSTIITRVVRESYKSILRFEIVTSDSTPSVANVRMKFDLDLARQRSVSFDKCYREIVRLLSGSSGS